MVGCVGDDFCAVARSSLPGRSFYSFRLMRYSAQDAEFLGDSGRMHRPDSVGKWSGKLFSDRLYLFRGTQPDVIHCCDSIYRQQVIHKPPCFLVT